MRRHGQGEAEEEEEEHTAQRHGRDRTGHAHEGEPSPSRSQSPARWQRPVAADFFEDGQERERERKERHRHHHRRRRHSRGSRSKSPEAVADGRLRHHKRRKHDHHHHHHHGHHTSTATHEIPAELPAKARHLSYKNDLDLFTPLFAYYLDIQKSLDFYALDSHEQRGRWKSFVNKWNRGELAEGWYDPEMFERIVREAPERPMAARQEDSGQERRRDSAEEDHGAAGEQSPLLRYARRLGDDEEEEEEEKDNDDDGDDDDYGPILPPGQSSAHPGDRKGPGIPSLSDLALQREDAASSREAHLAELRFARKADRREQKQQLDDILPRAEPGTRERQLEKRALVNEKMRGFRDSKENAALEEVGDADLMGGGDGVDDFKKAAASQQRKKTERELRREAEARARREEREERLREWKEREEEKLRGLKELAKARFG